MLQLPIYLDCNATTPIDPKVLEVMSENLKGCFGNASSLHIFGRDAAEKVAYARKQVASLIQAGSEEIIFTSGATESNNMVVKGIAYASRELGKGNHIITTQVEHKSVLESCYVLENEGFRVTSLPVDRFGRIDIGDIKRAITEKTVLISIIYANNEVGTINPISEIGNIAKEQGVFFHTDASQGIGKIESSVKTLNVDAMSISSHKMYGPKGVGALYLRKAIPNLKLKPLIHGGEQESKMRAGTLNVPGIIGLGKACEISEQVYPKESRRMLQLRNRLYEGIKAKSHYVHLNGHPVERLPGHLNLCFGYVESKSLLSSLKEIAISSISACSSSTGEASHVLRAMGFNEQFANSSVRFGIGRYNTEAEIDYTISKVTETAELLIQLSPSNSSR